MLENLALDRSASCWKCSRWFPDDATIFRHEDERPDKQFIQPWCLSCLEEHHPDWLRRMRRPNACTGCGILVSDSYGYEFDRGEPISHFKVCSPACAQVARNERRRKRPRVHICAYCGQAFPALRSDTRFRCNAHRQAAYRVRRGVQG